MLIAAQFLRIDQLYWNRAASSDALFLLKLVNLNYIMREEENTGKGVHSPAIDQIWLHKSETEQWRNPRVEEVPENLVISQLN